MPFNKEQINDKLEEIRFRNSVSAEDLAESLRPLYDNPAFREFFESEGMKDPMDLLEPGPAELEMMEDREKTWSGFVSTLFNTLRLLSDGSEEAFYSSLQFLAGSLDDIWGTFIEATEIQSAMKEIFHDCNPGLYSSQKEKIWVRLYTHLTDEKAKNQIISDINGNTEAGEKIHDTPDHASLTKTLMEEYKNKGDVIFDDLRKMLRSSPYAGKSDKK